ncbi:MAG: YXWGXW repeat-containing protein, partial [Candidatus Acidiferrum sp.]
VAILLMSAASFAQVGIGISVTIAPPELPVYEQPICPDDGYIWAPGYWAYGDDGYYWVPGTWVLPPEPGLLWTPAYWGWDNDAYIFHAGYWGPQVGFYGGIDYGFGYFGHGYEGGRWENGHFFYNRSVNHIDVHVVHNVYNARVERNPRVARVSYNGGRGGINARPTNQEQAAEHERHLPRVTAQTQHAQAAQHDPKLRASYNHGKPPIAATPKPEQFSGHGVVGAKTGGNYHATPPRTENNNARPEATRPEAGRPEAARPNTAVHPNQLPHEQPLPAPNTGNQKLDKKYEQQQQKLEQKQQKDNQKLQQKQDQQHQRLQLQKASDAKTQQLEQRHQQQTQQMQQKHTQQRQNLQKHEQTHSKPNPHTEKHPNS